MKNSYSVDDLLDMVDLKAWRKLENALSSKLKDVPQDGTRDTMFRLERNYSKYFDLEQWLQYHRRHARQMHLHQEDRPLRILDLGCGAGIFLFVCKAYGHSGVGLDVDSEMYKKMASILGVEYVPKLIEPMVPLEDRFEGFDWISAIAIKFDRLDFANLKAISWTLDEWKFLLGDLANRLNQGGKLYVKPNLFAPDQLFEDPAITDYLDELSLVRTPTNEFIIPREAIL